MDIRERLQEHADAEYMAFHQKICPNAGKIIGVRVPILKNIAKEIAKEDWQAFLLHTPADYYEEIMLQGLVIGNIACPLEERLQLIENFVPNIHNWAICDTVCGNLKVARKYPQEFWQFLLPYLSSQEEFEVRFGIVMLLDHFVRQEAWYQKVVENIFQVTHEGYYVKMAAAWTLAEAFLRYPAFMQDYLNDHFLEAETKKMMVRKLLDSRRFPHEKKEWLKKA